MNGTPCMPGEVHPAYVGQQWILDWMNGSGGYAGRDNLRVPIMPPNRWILGAADVTEPDKRQRVLTRHKAWGPAPYVGNPYVYVWPVAVDELGRMIGGEARMQHTGPPAAQVVAVTLRTWHPVADGRGMPT